MSTGTRTAVGPVLGYRHEAFLWQGIDAFLARTVPFVSEGLAAGEPVMVAVIQDHWAPLRDALGADAARVRFVDMAELGHNPARIIPAWRDFVESAGGRPVRGIGEPIWVGRRPAEIVECQVHEALLNLALPPDAPLWLLCPYDADGLDEHVIDEAMRSHPTLVRAGGTHPSTDYGGAQHVEHLAGRDLPAPTGPVQTVAFGRGELAALRRAVRARARGVGLADGDVDDLTLALNELAANSLDHGGGNGVLRMWTEPGTFVCEIADTGRITDPLIGRTCPPSDQLRGRGVWMVHQLCDLVQIRSTSSGTVVRVHSWL
ncbi:anti-sigma factor RsbA family regulatory protein [Cellulomonas fimi]|uniref:Sensor histidine kinase n=1 Tax=Cellulomonas fimi TaxID=1708 RepID=A0A7Y0LXJ6_CELFI|nr:anti-sigma factor RsbA family regulatory protein [Cellulomonas fimi]NMR19749.1 sensor histidine kinase [Cellulomonas fimi]